MTRTSDARTADSADAPDALARMESFEIPPVNPLLIAHGAGHGPDGAGCGSGGYDPAWRGL